MKPFFSGSSFAKLDQKNRFVLPQHMRYGLVEDGDPGFFLSLGLGGALVVHRKSEMERIVKHFEAHQNFVKLQPFFTVFFAMLYRTECDQLGRVLIPSHLKNFVGIDSEIVVVGVMNRIEVWPRDRYDRDMDSLLSNSGVDGFANMLKEAFSLVMEEKRGPVEERDNPDVDM